ncbi:MAG: glycosyltransferase [Thermodesulfobacteriota bacterium]
MPAEPLVSVILCTYNRPEYLEEAVRGVIGQELTEWELLVINDGGLCVGHILDRLADPRIRYFPRPENRGKAACCNFGLGQARGRYIAYLDDDDLWYPHHLRVLAQALDEDPVPAGVYSDLYSVTYAADPAGGRRFPVHKALYVSRNFNREFTFNLNHVLHVSLMHRKEAALRVGGYDESIRVFIDWNLIRKLSFVYDLKHVPAVTGEYMQSLKKKEGKLDEYSRALTDFAHISDTQRQNGEEFKWNLRRIKADLPPEPWGRTERVAALFPVIQWDQALSRHVPEILDSLDYPARLVLINNASGRSRDGCRQVLGRAAELANVSIIETPRRLGLEDAYRFAAERTAADYLLLVTDRYVPAGVEWRICSGLWHLRTGATEAVRWEVPQEKKSKYDLLTTKEAFLAAVQAGRPLKKELIPGGSQPDTPSFRSDMAYYQMLGHIARGSYQEAYQAAQRLLSLEPEGGIRLPAYFDTYFGLCLKLGREGEVLRLARELIGQGYAPDNLVRLGSYLEEKGRYAEAIRTFQDALRCIGLKKTDLDHPLFPFRFPYELDAFTALLGIGNSFFHLGDLARSEEAFTDAARLWSLSHRPFLGLGRICLARGRLDLAEQVLGRMGGLDGKDNPEVHLTLGELCEKRERWDLAFACYQKAIQFGPAGTNHLRSLYRAGARLGQWPRLKELFEEFLAQNPDNLEAAARLSFINRRLDEPGPSPGAGPEPASAPQA